MTRILITGAAGFLGSRLVRTLHGRHEVFALARRAPGESLAQVHWIEHDLAKPLDYAALPKKVDAIIHLAQSKSYKRFPEGAQDVFDVNIQGTFNLLEFGRKVGIECLIFASTGGVYGYSYEKFAETDPVDPLNFYFSSKYTAELLIANYQMFFRTVVFRFFFVYGPNQKGMLIPILLRKILGGEMVTIEGNPGLRINPIYVEDAIRVFEPALDLETSELFNVAGDENVTITDLVRRIARISNREALMRHTDSGPQGDLVGDNRRMKDILGVLPEVPLHEGLRRSTSPRSSDDQGGQEKG
jgi:nucleoside-diphosphate-sugar epimerase